MHICAPLVADEFSSDDGVEPNGEAKMETNRKRMFLHTDVAKHWLTDCQSLSGVRYENTEC